MKQLFDSNIHLNSKGVVVAFTIFATLLSTYPYVFSRFYPLPELTIVMALELFVLFLVGGTSKKNESLPNTLFVICFVQVIAFLLLALYHGDLFYLTRFALFTIISYFSLFVVHNNVGIYKFSHLNTYWLAIQAILGVVGFFLIFSNLINPIRTVTIGTYGQDYFYGITTTNAVLGTIARIAGYFDEPGAFAQWGVFALVLNKISPFYNKKLEKTLILCLIVTFSMAYFIQLALYLVLFNFTRVKKIVPILIFLIVGVIAASQYIPKDSELYYLTLRRFERTNGTIETNRDQSSELAKRYFMEDKVFGRGYTNLVNMEADITDNPYETLATSGIIGTFALYLPIIIILYKFRKKGSWQAVLILGVGYLQRPFHIQYIHYLMMYLLFLMCYYNNKTHKRLNFES